MSRDQIMILFIGTVTILMFLWGRWRHDMVAILSLLSCVVAGLVTAVDAFSGFGHPAVVTVACVLVLSRGLQNTGAVDFLAQLVLPLSVGPTMKIASICGLGAVLSAFMNNVGAMAFLMPVGVQIAGKHDIPPGKFLMPLAFSTILGGMTTLIGTPPNLIVSGFRAETGAGNFGMFAFTPVGLAVAGAGVAFAVLLGRHLVPTREPAGVAGFDTGTYLIEVRVTESGKAAGKTLREVGLTLEKTGAQIVGMVRNKFRVTAPNPGRLVQAGDILVIEAEPESLSSSLTSLGLILENDSSDGEDEHRITGGLPEAAVNEKGTGETAESAGKDSVPEEVVLQELVPMPDSSLVGRSANDAKVGTGYNLILLAISRSGRRSVNRLRSTPVQAGDVLLMQGSPEALSEFAAEFGCVPLARRFISIPDKTKAALAMLMMVIAIAAASFGLLPAAIAFSAGVLVFMVRGVVSRRKIYEAIDWPVIVMLGALIPVAGAIASTGAADLLAKQMLGSLALGNPIAALTLILVVTMTLSDFMNNAATAAVMCPIAISTATQLGASPDSFLMAVAIGASCAFLTPVGHQNNTLILGPGGFRFGDYWRMGLPLEILVVAISIPMLLLVWPL